MSFSNTSTGGAPADPYTKANADTKVDGPQKIKDFTDFITTSKYGMLTTHQAGSSRLVSRSMALAGTESNGVDLVFQINTESGKTDDIASDPDANVSFLDAKGSWASVAGRATVVTDRDEVQKYYSPILKAWLGDLGDGVHDGSENDPRIGLIKLQAETITHNVAEYGALKTAAKVTAAAVKGKPAEVNSLRYVSEDELKAWRSLLPFYSESSYVQLRKSWCIMALTARARSPPDKHMAPLNTTTSKQSPNDHTNVPVDRRPDQHVQRRERAIPMPMPMPISRASFAKTKMAANAPDTNVPDTNPNTTAWTTMPAPDVLGLKQKMTTPVANAAPHRKNPVAP